MRPQNQFLTCTGLSAPTAEIWPPEANSPHPGELEKAVQEPTQVCKRTGSSKTLAMVCGSFLLLHFMLCVKVRMGLTCLFPTSHNGCHELLLEVLSLCPVLQHQRVVLHLPGPH